MFAKKRKAKAFRNYEECSDIAYSDEEDWPGEGSQLEDLLGKAAEKALGSFAGRVGTIVGGAIIEAVGGLRGE